MMWLRKLIGLSIDFVCVPAEVHRRRIIIALLIALPIWGWFDVRQRGQINPNLPGLHMTDFTVYTEAGAAFFDGREPYVVANSRGWRYLYPPLFAMLVAPLDALDPQQQVLVWFAFNLLIVWGCYRETMRLAALVAEDSGGDETSKLPAWIAIVAVAAVTLPALNCLQRGQVGLVKLYLLLLGVRLSIGNRRRLDPWLAGFVLALAVVLKLTPLVPVGYLLVGRVTAALRGGEASRRSQAVSLGLATCTGLAVWLFVLPALLIGWQANCRHLHSWWTSVAMQTGHTADSQFAGNSLSPRNQSLSNSLRLFQTSLAPAEDGPAASDAAAVRNNSPGAQATRWFVRLATVGTLVVLVILAIAAGLTQDRLLQLAGFGMACVATLIASPISRAHYYVLLLPALVFVPLWLERHGRPRAARCSAVLPAALSIAHYAWIGGAGRIGLLGLGITLWYFGVAALLVWQCSVRRASRAVRKQSAAALRPAGVHSRAPSGLEPALPASVNG